MGTEESSIVLWKTFIYLWGDKHWEVVCNCCRMLFMYWLRPAFAACSWTERAWRLLTKSGGKCSAVASDPKKAMHLTVLGNWAMALRQSRFSAQSKCSISSCQNSLSVLSFGARVSVVQIISSSFRLTLRRLAFSKVRSDGFMTGWNITPTLIF